MQIQSSLLYVDVSRRIGPCVLPFHLNWMDNEFTKKLGLAKKLVRLPPVRPSALIVCHELFVRSMYGSFRCWGKLPMSLHCPIKKSLFYSLFRSFWGFSNLLPNKKSHFYIPLEKFFWGDFQIFERREVIHHNKDEGYTATVWPRLPILENTLWER